MNGNKHHPKGQDLVVEGILASIGDCPFDTSPASYSWDIMRNELPHPDPHGITGLNSPVGVLKVPASYFEEGDKMKLTIDKSTGQYTAWGEIFIESDNYLIVELECTGSCMKYINSLDTSLHLNVIGASDSLQYYWSTTPSIPYVSFDTQFRTLPTTDSITTDLLIEVSVTNETYFGYASIVLPFSSFVLSNSWNQKVETDN